MVLKVLFYTHTLNYRGTTQSILDYAKYNEEILGNESVIVQSEHTDDDMVRRVGKQFRVRTVAPTALNKFAEDYDVFYVTKAGKREEPNIDSTKHVIHAVFQFCDPHGDVYAYISEWLSDWMVACGYPRQPWVPYIVDLPKANPESVEIVRKNLGISKDQYVYGRLGAFETFNITFVQEAVIKTVNSRDDIVFVFPNTKPFYEHKNIVYVPPILDRQMKSDYIEMCDAMINGRDQGESFGLANAEFLFHNKPVLAWEEGDDRNHIRMLQPFGTLYNEKNVLEKIQNLDRPRMNYAAAVAAYTPERVMSKFKQVFLT